MKKDELWVCPKCGQKFLRKQQTHSCNDRTVESFLRGKSDAMVELYGHIEKVFKELGEVAVHPAKSQIGFATKRRFAFIPGIAKAHIDLALVMNEAFEDNLCFYRIGHIPGTEKYVHYARLLHPNDLNEELRMYMLKAIELSNT